MIEIQLESSLSDSLLDALAVGSIAGRTRTSLSIVNETTDLIGGSPRVLLTRAKAVHPGLQSMMVVITLTLLYIR